MRAPKPEGDNGRAETSSILGPKGLIPGITSWESGSFMCESPRSLFFSSPKNQQKVEVKTKDFNEIASPPNEERDVPPEAEVREEPPKAESTPTKEEKSEEEVREKPVPETPNESDATTAAAKFECDYDVNCTEAFMNLQKKEWNKANARILEFPLEAHTWVSRKEKHGKLRWRLLPIHAAIIFKAPDSVVEALLAAYPKGAQCKDDQGMLPLHLAFRHGSSEGTVNLLLAAFPQSVEVQDRKGRIPLVLAQASASPNREAFVRALERGPTYYANAAAATERAAVTAEQRAIFDAKLIEVEKKHQQDVKMLKEERSGLSETVELLQSELSKQKGTTQVLVDHVTSLEAQVNEKTETERFLAVKAASLDSELKELAAKKDQMEIELNAQIEGLQEMNEKLLAGGAVNAQDMELFRGKHEGENVKKLREKIAVQEKELKSLKMDWASAQARAAVLEAQLKSKIENEHELASEISTLTGKLASLTAGPNGSERVKELEQEREKLRATVNELSKKLLKVTQLMNKMQKKELAAEDEAKLLADASHQEELIRKAMEERKQMAEMLKKQEEEMERSAKQHQAILQKLSTMKTAPESQIPQSDSLAEEMENVLGHVLDGVPEDDDENHLVDTVVKNLKVETEKEEEPVLEDKIDPMDVRLDTFSSEFEEDPQKCLEDALKALEKSRAKKFFNKASVHPKHVVAPSASHSDSISQIPSDEQISRAIAE